ncbi:hypothetical protein [Streptomyces noursei]|uniref:hypothetical protein n=1 Tax=Streptomyces noursei TaxID=1971 RepID=UPI0030F23EF6
MADHGNNSPSLKKSSGEDAQMQSGETVTESVNAHVREHAERKAREGDERYADYGGPVAAKLRTELADVQKELADYKAQLARYQAASKAGIPLAHADRLKGETPEELEADAASLAKGLGSSRPLSKARPAPSVGGGVDAVGDTPSLDPMKLATAVLNRIKSH